MCVIIHQPKEAHLEKERALRLWNKNPDGGGFAFINDFGDIETYRFMQFEDFWPKFEEVRSNNPRRDYLLHMRIATHGTIDLNNVHPYQVNEGMVMAHNGIIHGVPDYGDGRSDTKVFIDEVLPRLPDNWLDDKYYPSMVEDWIGWSKLAFLTNDTELEEQVYIINKKSGTMADGMWFSNSNGVNTYCVPQGTKYPKVVKSRKAKEATKKAKKKQAVPKRSASTLGVARHYHEGSEDWTNWLDQQARDEEAALQTSLATGGSGNKQAMFSPEFLAERKDELMDWRRATDTKAEIWFDEVDNRWECIGCDEMVSPLNGRCHCWEKICMDCSEFAAKCACETGYSMNLSMYDNAPEDYQEWAMASIMGVPLDNSKTRPTGTDALISPF